MRRLKGVGLAVTKALIVLVPGYLAAFFTDKMVWVVPTLAASGILAASLKESASEEITPDDVSQTALNDASLRRRNEDDAEGAAGQDYQDYDGLSESGGA